MSIVLDGETFTIDALARLVRGAEKVALSPQARERNAKSHETVRGMSGSGAHVYGLTTGVGALKTAAVETGSADVDEQQLRFLRSHAGGAGEKVSAELGRATLAVRVNQLARGGAGIAPALLDGLCAALDDGAAPRFRELGSVGTADLAALAELGLGLLGQRPLEGIKPLANPVLGPRDGLMLMSSNARAIAEAALACFDLGRLLQASEGVAALSFEAARAEVSALDARVQQHRPHPGQLDSAAHLRALLEGYASPGVRLQDAFGFRCAPQVQGAAREAVAHLRRVVEIELNSGAENALITEGVALPNGNFHGAPLALALDFARNAVAQAGSLSAARLADLLDGEVTGLSAFLAQRAGPDSGLMILEYTAQEAVAELAHLAQPATRVTTLSQGIENHASFVALAARLATRSVKMWRVVVACELVAAVRAVRMRGQGPAGKGTRRLFEVAAGSLSAEMDDRPLVDDLDCAVGLLDHEALA